MKHILIKTIAAVLLMGCGPQPPDISITKAAQDGNIGAVKQHLAAGTDIELKCTGCGGTALGHAARHGHKGIAELLVENGADVNAEITSGNYRGKTPLDWAKNQETADLLRKHGGKTGEELKTEGK